LSYRNNDITIDLAYLNDYFTRFIYPHSAATVHVMYRHALKQLSIFFFDTDQFRNCHRSDAHM